MRDRIRRSVAAVALSLSLLAPAALSQDDCAPGPAVDALAPLAAAIDAALPGAATPAASRALSRARDALEARGAAFLSRTAAFRAAAKALDRIPGDPLLGPLLVAYDGLRADLDGEVADLQEVFLVFPGAASDRAKARIALLAARADAALSAGRVARAAAELHRAALATDRAREPKAELFGGPLRVIGVNVEFLSDVPLNRPIVIQFSNRVDPSTVRADTVQVRRGPAYAAQVPGSYEVRGSFVVFRPRLPTVPDLSDGGLQPNTPHRVIVPGLPASQIVFGEDGKPQSRTYVAVFQTAIDPNAAFAASEHLDAPPPRVLCTFPADSLPVDPWTHPGGAEDVPTDTPIRLVMNRVPLLPASVQPPAVELIATSLRGVPASQRIPGRVVLEQDVSRVVLEFVPAFPLPDRSRFVLRVDRSATDLSGGHELAPHEGRAAIRTQALLAAVNDPTGALATFAAGHAREIDPRTFLVFTTRDETAAEVERTLAFDGTDVDVDGGDGADRSRTNASFNDAVPGAVAGAVTVAGGDGRLGDFAPTQPVTLDTDSPDAPGGEFHFRSIRIPFGVTVSLRGSRPAVLRSRGDVLIEGILDASGGIGELAAGTVSSGPPTEQPGGTGGAGGGDGGTSYGGALFDQRGESGDDASGEGGLGGQGGGETAETALYSYPGGGGGGGHATAGAAGTDGSWSPSYPEFNGPGGAAGGARGVVPSSDATADGRAFAGMGGGGGGAGGNGHIAFSSINYRYGGAGGGGGGGGVLVSTAGSIRFSGLGLAEGGAGGAARGGGGYFGAPGGGGAGGTIAFYAEKDIDVAGGRFFVHGGAAGATGGLGGRAGAGGDGFLRFEDADATPTGLLGASVAASSLSIGRFDPTTRETDPPAVFEGTWFVLPAFQPEVLPFVAEDLPQSPVPGAEIVWEIQMADDSPQAPGRPDLGTVNPLTGASSDLDRASGWVLLRDAFSVRSVAAELNGRGYQHFRVRVSFRLPDGLRAGDPMPSVDSFRIRLRHQD